MAEHGHKEIHFEVEKISNGWLLVETVEKKSKKGMIDFQTTKTYHAEKPKITVNKINATGLMLAGLVRRIS